jgi:uncharacterized membrane protein
VSNLGPFLGVEKWIVSLLGVVILRISVGTQSSTCDRHLSSKQFSYRTSLFDFVKVQAPIISTLFLHNPYIFVDIVFLVLYSYLGQLLLLE